MLVHGAWHGGWCWHRVADRLRQAGHRVFTPTLTGVGERSHLLGPAVDAETHIRDVLGLLEAEELEDVVEALATDGCFSPASLDRPVGDATTMTLGEALEGADGAFADLVRPREGD